MNTMNGAVTEYDWAFQSITPTHAGDALGLYDLAGDLDGDALIVARVMTGTVLRKDSLKMSPQMLYFSMRGDGIADAIVKSRDNEWSYPLLVRSSGESRSTPGKGIRETYLAFGFETPGGEDFTIDRIEALVAKSATRRV